LSEAIQADAPFHAGALFCVIALAALMRRPPAQAANSVR